MANLDVATRRVIIIAGHSRALQERMTPFSPSRSMPQKEAKAQHPRRPYWGLSPTQPHHKLSWHEPFARHPMF